MQQSGVRSAALARAQAQLSGMRVPTNRKDSTDELQEYMDALNKKTSALKLNKMPIPGLSDLSDLSIDSTGTEDIKGNKDFKHRVKDKENGEQVSTGQSRFLKKKQNVAEKLASTAGSTTAQEKRPVTQVSTSMARSSAALKKLAEIESKIMSRKLGPQLSDTDSDPGTSGEKLIKSSSDLSAQGSRFVKRTESSKRLTSATNQKQGEKKDIQMKERRAADKKQEQRIVEREGEEIRKQTESSLEFSDEDHKWWKLPSPSKSEIQLLTNSQTKDLPRTPSPPSRGSPRRTLHKTSSLLSLGSLPMATSRVSSRTPSPPSRGSPQRSRRVHSLTRFTSRSPSPSVRSSLTSTSSPRMKPGGRSWRALSQRSEIKSLDELFSKASVTEDLDSESSNDFKLNILSLDDLQPITYPESLKATETKDSKEKTENVAWATMASEELKPVSEVEKKVPELFKNLTLLKGKSITIANESPSETDEEMEISEQLNGDSSVSIVKDQSSRLDSSTTDGVHSNYSEDFEKSSIVTESKNTENRSSHANETIVSSAGKARKQRESSLASKGAALSLQPGVRWAEDVRKITVKEMAVQTMDPGFTYCWSNMDSTATLGQHLGAAYINPVPIATHVISPEAVEALTAYSPAALALNDMLKQQLMLIQQFVEINRHMYLSLLQSLENETYHYITLEETQEYIKGHRSAPLPTKKVLQEVQERSRHPL
ncbi:uncharacterized protein C19orf44 homolog isoform X2 [Rhinatrema bivittatum]|nr:uncharacterized protein C19orf44 homolog isoform X2 [Rhinatrema bivittatum]XP_029470078.1 uncharacterized protein C19orf44 homolog isoform X2 [Rhinatrema bivittatum]